MTEFSYAKLLAQLEKAAAEVASWPPEQRARIVPWPVEPPEPEPTIPPIRWSRQFTEFFEAYQ